MRLVSKFIQIMQPLPKWAPSAYNNDDADRKVFFYRIYFETARGKSNENELREQMKKNLNEYFFDIKQNDKNYNDYSKCGMNKQAKTLILDVMLKE